jgi:hypothetical protein
MSLIRSKWTVLVPRKETEVSLILVPTVGQTLASILAAFRPPARNHFSFTVGLRLRIHQTMRDLQHGC